MLLNCSSFCSHHLLPAKLILIVYPLILLGFFFMLPSFSNLLTLMQLYIWLWVWLLCSRLMYIKGDNKVFSFVIRNIHFRYYLKGIKLIFYSSDELMTSHILSAYRFFFSILRRLFTETTHWSEDTSSEEEYASQFNARFILHFHENILYLCIRVILVDVCSSFSISLWWFSI